MNVLDSFFQGPDHLAIAYVSHNLSSTVLTGVSNSTPLKGRVKTTPTALR